MTGPELQLKRIAMGVTQAELAAKIVDPRTGEPTNASWVTRREGKARVRPVDEAAYLTGLATFGTVPTVRIEVAPEPEAVA